MVELGRMKRILVLIFLVLLVASVVAFAIAHRDNVRIAAQIESLRARIVEKDALRIENQRLERSLEFANRNDTEAGILLREELVRAKRALANLQTRGRDEIAPSNQTPQSGLTPLVQFMNVGCETPSAAFQTAVFACMKDEKALFSSVVWMAEEAKVQAAASLLGLSAKARHEYPSPESLATLALANQILRGSAFEILETNMSNDSHAVLSLKVSRDGTASAPFTLPMHRGPNGWQIVVSARAIHNLIIGKSDAESIAH
jgi:hypothetical protein